MAWAYNTHDDTLTWGPKIAIVSMSFTGGSLFVMLARLYVRAFLVRALGYDDLLIFISWLGACGYTVTTVIQTKWGLGIMSLDDMPKQNLFYFQLSQYIGAPLYVISIWGFKISLLLSFLRFIPMPMYRKVIIAIMVIITTAHIAFLCGFLFLCTPISKQWDPSITWGHCAAGLPFYLSFSALTIVFDATVMIVPLPVLIKAQIQTPRKLILLALFVLGIFVTIIQIIRIDTIKNLSNYINSAISIIWSIIETDTGIIIASIPTLPPAVKAVSARLRGAATRSKNSSQDTDTTMVPSSSHSNAPLRLEMDSWGCPKPAVPRWGSRDEYDEELGFVGSESPVDDTSSADRILGPISPIMRTKGPIRSPTIRVVYIPRRYSTESVESPQSPYSQRTLHWKSSTNR
ncbi:hypothetical protein LMH87_004244 [Akanthomyces muscarius]|uniref:Rhodopsin domain-containing protein n=1 Tax=Akanthomyces muscarius TaxID=2231603 RepID=A0A9W8UFF7_AKAMU|nr:hypothetical protein LMH87_004244 [Akanthomyces muscarius]KAJ4145392.1 hypothetical protein LMH87_004244 [Akanthomyces muscarius]